MTIMAERSTDYARNLIIMLTAKPRHVRTVEGSDLYGQPIGAVITPDMLKPPVKSLAQMKSFPPGTRVTQETAGGKETHYTKQKDGTWKSSKTNAYGPAGILGPAIVAGKLKVTKLPGETVSQEDYEGGPDAQAPAGEPAKPTPAAPAAPKPAPGPQASPGAPDAATQVPEKTLGVVDLVNQPEGARITVTTEQGSATFTKLDTGNWRVDGAGDDAKGHHSTSFKKYTDAGQVKIAGAEPNSPAAKKAAEEVLDEDEKKAVAEASTEPKVVSGKILDTKEMAAAPNGIAAYLKSDTGQVSKLIKGDTGWKPEGSSMAYDSSMFKSAVDKGLISWDSPEEEKAAAQAAPPALPIAEDGSEAGATGGVASVDELNVAQPGTKIKNVAGTASYEKQAGSGLWKSATTGKLLPGEYFAKAIANGAMEFESAPAVAEEPVEEVVEEEAPAPEPPAKPTIEYKRPEKKKEEPPAEPTIAYKKPEKKSLTDKQKQDLADLESLPTGAVVWVKHGDGGQGQPGQYKYVKQEDGTWKPSQGDPVPAEKMLDGGAGFGWYPWVQQSDKPKGTTGPKEPYKAANNPKVAELDALPPGTKIAVKHPVKGMGAAIYTYKKNEDGTWRTLKDNMGVTDYSKAYNASKAKNPSTELFVKGNSTYTVISKPEQSAKPDEPDQGTPAEPAPEPAPPTPAATPVLPPEPEEAPSGPYTGSLKVGDKIANDSFVNFKSLPAGTKVEGINGSTLTRQDDGSWKHDRTGKSFSSKNLYVNGANSYKLNSLAGSADTGEDATQEETSPASAPKAPEKPKFDAKKYGAGSKIKISITNDWGKKVTKEMTLGTDGKWRADNGPGKKPNVWSNTFIEGREDAEIEDIDVVSPGGTKKETAPEPAKEAKTSFKAFGETVSMVPGSTVYVDEKNLGGLKYIQAPDGKWYRHGAGSVTPKPVLEKNWGVFDTAVAEGRLVPDPEQSESGAPEAESAPEAAPEPPPSTDMAPAKLNWWQTSNYPQSGAQLDDLPVGSRIHESVTGAYYKKLPNGQWQDEESSKLHYSSELNSSAQDGYLSIQKIGDGESEKIATVKVWSGDSKGDFAVPAGSKVYHFKDETSEAATTKYIKFPDGSWHATGMNGNLIDMPIPWSAGDNGVANGAFVEDSPTGAKPPKGPNEPYTPEEIAVLPIGTQVLWKHAASGATNTYTKTSDSAYWVDPAGDGLHIPTEASLGYVFPLPQQTSTGKKTITVGPYSFDIPEDSVVHTFTTNSSKAVKHADGSWTVYFPGTGTVQEIDAGSYSANNTDALVQQGHLIPEGSIPAVAAPEPVEESTPVAPGGIDTVQFNTANGDTFYAPAGSKVYSGMGDEPWKYVLLPDGTWKQYSPSGAIAPVDAASAAAFAQMLADGSPHLIEETSKPQKLHPSGLKPGKYSKAGGKVYMIVGEDGTAAYIDKSGEAKPLGTKGVLGYHKNGFTNWSPYTGAIPVPGTGLGDTAATPKKKLPKGTLPVYSSEGVTPLPFDFVPVTGGYAESFHELTNQMVKLAEQSGFKNVAAQGRSGMTAQEKKDWAKYWYNGQWDLAYQLELKGMIKSDKDARPKNAQELDDAPVGTKLVLMSGKYSTEYTKYYDGWRRFESGSTYQSEDFWSQAYGSYYAAKNRFLVFPDKVKHPKAAQHPGSPDNPINNPDGFKKINFGPAVAGEIKAGGPVSVTLPESSYNWSAEDVDSYMYAAGMQNAHGLSQYQKKTWTQYHVGGNQAEVDRISLAAQKNVQAGSFQSEPLGPAVIPILAGDEVPDFTPAKPFNTGSSHANNLTPEEVDSYLQPLFGKKAYAALKAQPVQTKRAVAQLHWLSTMPTTKGAYKSKQDATEAFTALQASIENQVKNSSYGSTAAISIGDIKPVSDFTYAKVQPSYKGAFEKFDVEDDTGTAYLFKPAKGGDPYRAEVAHGAHLAAQLFGYKPAQSYVFETKNKNGQTVYGQAQSKLENQGDLGNINPSELTEKQFLGVIREHVLDWAINQDDSHRENFFITPDGGIVGIDKDRAWAFFGTQKLERGKMKGPHVVETPYYEEVYKAIADGKIDPALVQKAYKVAMQNARRIQNADEARYRAILEDAFKNNKKLNDASRAKLIDDVVARKNSMVDDFETFFNGIFEEAGIAKPDDKLPMSPGLHGGFTPELMEDVRAGRIHGHSTFFAGQDLEDGHILLWEEKGANGGPPVLYGQAQVLKSGDDKFVNWLNEHYNGPDSISGVSSPVKTLKNQASYDEKIIRGIKDIRRKMSGKSHQESNITGLLTLRNEMQNYLNNSQYETDYPDMPKKQAAHKEMLETYISKINAALQAEIAGNKPEIFVPYNYVWQDEDKIDLEPTPKLGYKITKRESQLNTADVDVNTNTLTDTGATSSSGQTGHDYVIELEDGTEVIYRPWGTTSDEYYGGGGVNKSHQGTLRFRAAGHNDHVTGQRVHDFLREVGLEVDDVTEEDLELQYWRSLYGIMMGRGGDKNSGAQAKVTAAVNSDDPRTKPDKTAELDRWRQVWGEYKGQELVDKFVLEQGYLPHFSKTTIQDPENGHGRPYWNRFDVDINKIRLEDQFLARSQYGLYGGDSSMQDDKIFIALRSGGVFPIMERARSAGKWHQGGGSGNSDSSRGSGSFTFIRQNQESSHYHIYFDPALMARTNTYSYNGDSFGSLSTRSNHAYFDIDKLTAHSAKDSNEGTIKYGASILSDAVLIVFYDPKRRQEAIDLYKSHGINDINGVPLEEVFVTKENRQAGLKAAHARMKARVLGTGYDPANSAFVANMPKVESPTAGQAPTVAAPTSGEVKSATELNALPIGTKVKVQGTFDGAVEGQGSYEAVKVHNGWQPLPSLEDDDPPLFPPHVMAELFETQESGAGNIVGNKVTIVPTSATIIGSVGELEGAPEGTKINVYGAIYTKTEDGADGFWESPNGLPYGVNTFAGDIDDGNVTWYIDTPTAVPSGSSSGVKPGDDVTSLGELNDAPIGAEIHIDSFGSVKKGPSGDWIDADGDYTQESDLEYFISNGTLKWVNPGTAEPETQWSVPNIGASVKSQAELDAAPAGYKITSKTSGAEYEKQTDGSWYKEDAWGDGTTMTSDNLVVSNFTWSGLSAAGQANTANDNPAATVGGDVAGVSQMNEALTGSVIKRVYSNGNTTDYTKTSDGFWEEQFTGSLLNSASLWEAQTSGNASSLAWFEVTKPEDEDDGYVVDWAGNKISKADIAEMNKGLGF